MEYCSSDSCPISGGSLGFEGSGDFSSATLKLSSLLLLLGFQDKSADAVITNVSVIQSWRWFFHLSPFESVFLALIIAQIGTLGWLGILPVNLNQFWKGEASGRKKRSVPPHVAFSRKEIGSKLLILYKKLDQNECGFRALCELQSKVSCGEYEKRRFSKSTQLLLSTLLRFAKRKSSSYEMTETQTEVDDMAAALQPYVDAVKLGSQNPAQTLMYANGTQMNSSSEPNACQTRYPLCPVTTEEVMEYVERIDLLGF